jgi:hypothetical protein
VFEGGETYQELFGHQSHLPEVMGHMIRAAQQDRETVSMRFLREVFRRYRTMLL